MYHVGQRTAGTVSYTHLDVYKRQGWKAADGRKDGADSGFQGGVRVRCQPDRGRTDVYKRQTLAGGRLGVNELL